MKRIKQLAALVLALCLCAPARASDGSFPDVPPDSWFAGAVEYCVENGLMGGVNGFFRPEDTMTRAMLAEVLYRASGSPAPEGAGAFPDVPEHIWYARSAQWAFEAGVMGGGGDGFFQGDAPVTREQFAAILWRYAGEAPASGASHFSDEEEIAPYAREAVDWAAVHDVAAGFPDNRFAPQENVTRAQAAMMLMRSQTLAPYGTVSLLTLGNKDIAPSGIAAAGDGLVITDAYNRVVWQIRGTELKVLAGGETARDVNGQPVGGYHDGPADRCSFKLPWAVAPFLDGWAVSDAENNAVRYLTGGTVQTLNCSTTEKGLATSGGVVAFSYPTGLAAGSGGSLYLSDTHQGAIRKIAPDGSVTTYASGLSDPMGLCWSDGALYVAETGANRIVKIVNGRVSVVAGSGQEGAVDGPAAQAAFALPQGVAVDGGGTLYVADTGNGAVRCIRDGEVTTLFSRELALDGEEGSILYPASPMGLLIVGENLYVCDSFNQAVYVIAL